VNPRPLLTLCLAAALAAFPSSPPLRAQEGAAASDVPSPAELEADRALDALLRGARDDAEQTSRCFDLAWGPQPVEEKIRRAALRRLRQTEARVYCSAVLERIETAPPEPRVEMLKITSEKLPELKGVDVPLITMIAVQIRSTDRRIAAAAIEIAGTHALRQAYLPLREILANPRSPLRNEAVRALGRIRDPRAVEPLRKLLDDDPSLKPEIYRALTSIGRPSSLVLKMRLDVADPAERALALDALLEIATPEDLGALYTFVQRHRPEGETKRRLYQTIALLEAAEGG
jgi:hypothetical protein